MKLISTSPMHHFLLFVIAIIFILDGCWQLLKGATSLIRRYRQQQRANEPAVSVSWFQILLGATMLLAGCILLFSAITGP